MLSDLAVDERRARMVLSMIAEPADTSTGRVLAEAGAVETLRLTEAEAPVPALGEAEAGLWRAPGLPRYGVSTRAAASR